MARATQRRTLRVNFLSGRQGKVLVCDGELCGGGGEAGGGDGSDARCCWAGCAEERWGEHGVYTSIRWRCDEMEMEMSEYANA